MAARPPDAGHPIAMPDPLVSALVIHDLKNRLAEQGAMLRALDAEAPDLARRIDALRAQGADLQRRLVAFLTLYRLDTAPAGVEPDDASPARLLQAAAAHAPQGRQDVVVRLDLARCPVTWVLDAPLVQLAMEAALDNAMRHARRDVALGAAPDGDWLVLWVEDDGPGIGGQLPAPGAASTHHPTGLGTALCRRVAQRHRSHVGQGTVSLGARADGTGTRFEMRLPA